MKRLLYIWLILYLAFLLPACTAGQPEATEEPSQAPTWQEQYDLGVRYLSDGDYEGAVLAFSAAIEIAPKRAPAYVGRGDAYVKSGETETNLAAAKADYEKAIELDETGAEAYLGLADVYVRQGDYEKAIEILERGTEKTGGTGLRERLDAVRREAMEDDPNSGTDGNQSADSDENFTVIRDMSKEGVQLIVKTDGSRTASITLSGLSLRDTYIVNLSDSDASILEYGWEVTMYGDQMPFGVGTTSWCWSPGLNETKALADMQHNMWGPGDNPEFANTYVEGDCSMHYTSNSITWVFTVPAEYAFDFKKVSHYEVKIGDVTKESGQQFITIDFYV